MRWSGNISRKSQCSLESDVGQRGEHLDCVFGCSLNVFFYVCMVITVYFCTLWYICEKQQ